MLHRFGIVWPSFAVFWPSQPVGPIVSMKSPTFQLEKSCGNFRPLLFENLLLSIPNQGLKDGAAGMQRAFGTNTDFRTLGTWVLTWHGGCISLYLYNKYIHIYAVPKWCTYKTLVILRNFLQSQSVEVLLYLSPIRLQGHYSLRDWYLEGPTAAWNQWWDWCCDVHCWSWDTKPSESSVYTDCLYMYYMMCVYNIHTLRTLC